ncbi:unnamed protein product [Moneuplotes crassus]|uniref:Uncharacterized protein n=1 Tax=Euplotes crassus TaxID=5936 RepID=A0AAD1XVH3_EUPCR|nr:unnamed protein product [Moneuplotes crassus]
MFSFKKLTHIKLETLGYYGLWQDRNHKNFSKFITNKLTKDFNMLAITFDQQKRDKTPYYSRFIIKLLPGVMKSFYLCYSNISQRKLRRIIQFGRHIERIEFEQCDIEFRGIGLSKSLHYSIHYIYFYFMDSSKYYPPGVLKEDIQDFIKAISTTDLSIGLKQLTFDVPEYFQAATDQSITLNCINFNISCPNLWDF